MRALDGAKYEILGFLLKEELSAQGLAERLSVSATAVRQHLDALRAMGLVVRRKLVTRPSRPTFLYRLSAAGTRTFPKRYDLLLALVVDVLLERNGSETVDEVVRAAAERLAARVRDRFARSAPPERWQLLLGWMEDELGWQATAAPDASGGDRIVINHCPFQDVSRNYPAVCSVFFTTLIRALYGDVPVQKLPEAPAPACCALLVRR